MKLDNERLKKANSIISEVESLMMQFKPQNNVEKENILMDISNILCKLDTDIAIYVMENFGEEGKNIALSIKVNYGY